ncbi:MAG: beta-L-arabinofuranosidase domain-containing protein, partial [Promethearchaeota archaeon]
MSLITGKAQYADLIEWQLYNAAAVGIALDGQSYLYRNPLESTGELTRRAWFRTACCPSNISRLWGKIGQYIFSSTSKAIWVHQYIGNHSKVTLSNQSNASPTKIEISMESGFPWEGESTLHLMMERECDFTLFLRIPGWSSQFELYINQELYKQERNPNFKDSNRFGGGFSPYASYYTGIHRTWQKGDVITIKFPMDILVREADQRVKADRGKISLSRGPIIYCIESNDNSHILLQKLNLDLQQPLSYRFSKELLGGIGTLRGFDNESHPLFLIPYYAWSNRGKSQMQVWHTFRN